MKPELLAPAGSPAALHAAVDAGADAVYFGAQSFNARKNAENFTEEELYDAIRYCRLFGVKTHIVLNTQLYTRELEPAVALVKKLLLWGADAFLVADIGLAATLIRRFPNIVLHASTQACGQNVLSAEELSKIGFQRMVAPRELSLEDIRTLCRNSPIETEIFVHGALCASHSGQCLFSSVIGGRSGNRGECAQPCRLPYQARHPYALSLKDLCLAEHIPQIMEAGVASLKIEGRMKSPEYVYGTVSVYRRLIDECRSATPDETASLARLFSRSGFTDGYFTRHISSDMLGIRTEEDKRNSAAGEGIYRGEKKRLPLEMQGVFLSGEPALLRGTVRRGEDLFSAEVKGNPCIKAEKTPTGKERFVENLSKLGETVFNAVSVDVKENGVYVPISEINGLRRSLCAELFKQLTDMSTVLKEERDDPQLPMKSVCSDEKSAYFLCFDSVTPYAATFFDRIFLPLSEYIAHLDTVSRHANIGIALPPVSFDHELSEVREMTGRAVSAGCRFALASGLWQARVADEFGIDKHGDLRLNLYNFESVDEYRKMGFRSVVLSPEIGAAASSRLTGGIPKGYVMYGRLPLMTLEKCVIRDQMTQNDGSPCLYCDTHRFSYLTDRIGARFLLRREFRHRNVLYNSVPVYMADKPIPGLFRHCIFTDEPRGEVDKLIRSFENMLPPTGKFKRL